LNRKLHLRAARAGTARLQRATPQAGKIVVTTDGLVDVEASERLLAQAKDPLKEGVRQHHERGRRRRDGDRGTTRHAAMTTIATPARASIRTTRATSC
jgi:hypothetical protein